MNEEESKIIPLRKATNEELIEVIADLHTQNYLKEMEIVRLNNIINKIKEELEAYIRLCVNINANDILDMVEYYIKGDK